MRSNWTMEADCSNKDFLELTNHFLNRFSVIILFPEKSALENRNPQSQYLSNYFFAPCFRSHLMYPQFNKVYPGMFTSGALFTEGKNTENTNILLCFWELFQCWTLGMIKRFLPFGCHTIFSSSINQVCATWQIF